MSAVELPPLVGRSGSPAVGRSPPSPDEPRPPHSQTPRRSPLSRKRRESGGRQTFIRSVHGNVTCVPTMMGMTPNAMQRIALPVDSRADPRRKPTALMPNAHSPEMAGSSSGRENRIEVSDERRRPRNPSMLERSVGTARKGEAICDEEPLHHAASEEVNSPSPNCLKPRVPAEVSNAYSIGKLLGSGAFGTVWMAVERGSLEHVAIKIIERKRQLQENFALEPAEAEILKDIDHPCVVKLMDYVLSEYCLYLVMELVMGGHLQSRLDESGAYNEARGKRLVLQVLDAVHHLHERNIIHRDIKPENILFVASEPDELSIKLSDFGLSTQKEGRLTTRCGTPSYCAPELLSGEGYGKMVDMWSVGILAYAVLTASLPFIGSDRADLFRRIQKGCYTYEGSSPSEYARDLIARLLKLEPMERYSTREALQHPWLSNESSEDLPLLLRLNTVHEMMRQFNAERRLRRVMLVVIACGRFRSAGQGWPQPTSLGSPVCGWSDDDALAERGSLDLVRADFAMCRFPPEQVGQPCGSREKSPEGNRLAREELGGIHTYTAEVVSDEFSLQQE